MLQNLVNNDPVVFEKLITDLAAKAGLILNKYLYIIKFKYKYMNGAVS